MDPRPRRERGEAMKWIKAPEELKTFIQSLMQSVDCEKRPMFGYPAFFINKNMFAGLFQDKLFLRISPDQYAILKERFPSIANLEPMPGRPMKDYFVIPEKLYRDTRMMPRVVQECAAYCEGLAPKAAKTAKASKTKASRKPPKRP
jgi:TfoX/Sxy family transcriptional regulator of competence genes